MVKSVKKPEVKPVEASPVVAPKAPATPKTARAPVRKTAPVAAPAKPEAPLSLQELAAAILADQIVPTLEQSKALAEKVLKRKKVRKLKGGPKDAAKPNGKADKPSGKADKKVKAKAGKKDRASAKQPQAVEPKVRLPKLRAG